MQVGKAKLSRDRKDLAGCFHRGHGGKRARKTRLAKRVIEKGIRQAGRRTLHNVD